MVIINFIILAYLLGPVVAIPYGLNVMHLSPGLVYVYLSAVYIVTLPVLFWILEYVGHYSRHYRLGIFRKFSRMTDRKYADVVKLGDEIQEAFEQRAGHLGFYFSLSVLTFLVGIFWAVLFAYALRIKKAGAILFIALGVIVGDAFWLLVSLRLLQVKTPLEVLLVALLIALIVYGKKREKEVLKWVASRTRMRRE